ncbi:ABC transporter permease subunit [Thioalkalicoccus limnaeus]|uniref:ABC transporter permease subunit n=1 Tax=Thioalkalicoccus limnaeus TaxID=120681 RepID=A0ABV4BBE6_9GAMM
MMTEPGPRFEAAGAIARVGFGPLGAIAWRDLRAALQGPALWILLGLHQFILGWVLLQVLERFTGIEATARVTGLSLELSLNLFSVAALLALFTAPLLAMRSLSGERRDGTYALLASAPVPLVTILLGKYLALSAMMSLQLLPPLILIGLVAMVAELDAGLLAAGMLGLWLTLLSFAAIGLFASSLSHQPVATAVAGYGVLLTLSVIGRARGIEPGEVSLFEWLSWNEHLFWFLSGVVRVSDLVYFVLLSAFFLALAHRRLANMRLA